MKIDYALITALICIAVVFGAGAVGRGMQSIFNTAAVAIGQEGDQGGAEGPGWQAGQDAQASDAAAGKSGQTSGGRGGVN